MPVSSAPPGMLRILVVEDEAITALDLSAILQRCGHEVVGVTGTAAGARELAALHRPDLVLVDVNLGDGGDGVEAATDIREALDIRAIFLTAYSDARTRDRAQAAWPLGLVKKPFEPEALGSVLRGAANLIKAQRRVPL